MEKEFYKFPFEIVPVNEEISKRIMLDFTGERTGFVRVGPKKYFFPHKFLNEADNYYNTEIRADDIWVVSFPRSGTTLTQELVWLIANNLDYEEASTVPLAHRFPFFEFGLFFHDDLKKELVEDNGHSHRNQEMLATIWKDGWELLPEMRSPRFIKSHFPISLLPKQWKEKKCKTIYVARNPKDVAVSFYHLSRLFKTQGFHGNFTKYWRYFQESLQPWTPYWHHVEEGWSHRNDSNVLFLFYENILQDMCTSIESVCTFLNKPQLDKAATEKLMNYLEFSNFKRNAAVSVNIFKELHMTNPGEQDFIRKGKIGENADEVAPDVKELLHNWIAENEQKVNLKFPHFHWY